MIQLWKNALKIETKPMKNPKLCCNEKSELLRQKNLDLSFGAMSFLTEFANILTKLLLSNATLCISDYCQLSRT